MKIDLLIVATNNYIKFLPDLINSVKTYFLTTEEVKIYVFTDNALECHNLINDDTNVAYRYIEHKPWPHATLNRFHFFKEYINEINGDYIFYIDADTIIMDEITTDILSDFTVVQHCGFVNGGGSWETREESECYVSPQFQKQYYGGGFYGFSKEVFKPLISIAVDIIDEDIKNGITPVWHDESALNFITSLVKNPLKVLSPSYHYPENNPRIINSWKEQYPCKILLLDKNHKEIR